MLTPEKFFSDLGTFDLSDLTLDEKNQVFNWYNTAEMNGGPAQFTSSLPFFPDLGNRFRPFLLEFSAWVAQGKIKPMPSSTTIF